MSGLLPGDLVRCRHVLVAGKSTRYVLWRDIRASRDNRAYQMMDLPWELEATGLLVAITDFTSLRHVRALRVLARGQLWWAWEDKLERVTA